MASLINQPPNTPVQDMDPLTQQVRMAPGWPSFFNATFMLLTAMTMSGTTANRPTKFLWTGRPFFDTTLGYPIWYKTASWVKADGSAA